MSGARLYYNISYLVAQGTGKQLYNVLVLLYKANETMNNVNIIHAEKVA